MYILLGCYLDIFQAFPQMFSKMIEAKTIVEIGTYTGYSALCLAEGLSKNGILHTIDKDASLQKKVKSFFSESKKNNQIEYMIGDAIEIIPKLECEFDMVFIDADKINYINYFD